jgi:proline iminopeptidase
MRLFFSSALLLFCSVITLQTSHAEVKPQSIGIVHTSDTDIAYEQFGRDAGHTPAIVVNGGPGSSHTYMYLTDVFTKGLAHDRSVTFYDQRGIGKSKLQRDSAPQGIEAQVADLEALRAKLGYNKVDLIGHSWGGNIVMAYAAAYPQHVQHLVLIDSRAPVTDKTISLYRQVYPDQLAEDEKAAKGSTADAKSEAEMVRRSLARTFYSQDKFNEVIGKLTDDEVLRVQSAEINKAVEDAVKSLDLTDSLKKFNFPTLIMWGRFDMGIPVRTGWEISQAIPGSRMVIYAKSGHYPFYEQESQFLNDLDDFLNQ